MISTRPSFTSSSTFRRSAPLSSFLTLAVGLVLLVAFATPAVAAGSDDDERRYRNYFEFQAGWDFVPHQSLGGGEVGESRVESANDSFNVGGAIGRHINDWLRAELAFSYREATVDNAGVVAAVAADGDVSLFAGMLNVYADIDLGIPVVPYIGFGIGGGLYKLDVRQKTQGDLEIDDEDSVFVYNAMVGAKVPISEYVDFSLGYRYVATAGGNGTAAVITPETATQEIDSEFDAHEVVAGLKFNF